MENGTPIITTEHFKFGSLPNSKEGTPQVSAADYSRLSGYILQKDDIVFSRVGSVDINALVEDSQHSWLFSGRVLRVRSFENINSLYLHYELSTTRVKNSVISRAVGQTMPSINTEILKNTMVSLPRYFEEQQKIGSLFKHLDNTIALHQRKLDKLKRFKHGYLQQLFPKNGEKVPRVRFANFENEWELHKLEDIIISELKGKAKAEMYGTSSPYLETNYLNGGEVSYVDSPINVDKDDVIILWDGSQAGTVYHGFKGALGSTLKAYSPKGSGEYLYQYLKLNQQVIYDSYRTPNIPHVIKTFTKEFNVHFTCYEEQDKVGSFLNQLDEIIDLYQSKVDKLKLLKKGFLQKMFI